MCTIMKMFQTSSRDQQSTTAINQSFNIRVNHVFGLYEAIKFFFR